jgi:uncharacterized membrane protein YdjX (TVP38/TMEM64 family)
VAIDPAVQKGLDAYRSSRFHAAHNAWELAAAGATGDHRGLLAALADLAGALEREHLGRDRPAADLLDDLRNRLEGLPDQVLGVDVDRLRASLPDDPADALAHPPEVPAARPVPRWVLWRFVLFVMLVGAGFVVLRFTPLGERFEALLDRERLMALRDGLRAQWWTGPALVAAYSVLAPLGAPVSPLMLAGGAIFGAAMGAFLNIVGTFLGAAGSFYLARWLGRDFVVHVMGNRLRRVERLVARRGFWTWVRIRFLPIPFPVVNYGAALTGVPAALFLVATGIGLIPANVVYTYFASALVDSVGGHRAEVLLQLGFAVACLLTLSFLPNVLEARRRKKRYQELVEHRKSLGR